MLMLNFTGVITESTLLKCQKKINMGTTWAEYTVHGVVNKQHYIKLKANMNEITWLKFGTYTFLTISLTK